MILDIEAIMLDNILYQDKYKMLAKKNVVRKQLQCVKKMISLVFNVMAGYPWSILKDWARWCESVLS